MLQDILKGKKKTPFEETEQALKPVGNDRNVGITRPGIKQTNKQ